MNTVGRVVSRARQVRLQHQAKIGQPLTVDQLAQDIDADRGALTRLELDQLARVDLGIIAKLCAYYGVGTGDLLVYIPAEEVQREDASSNLSAAH